MSQISKLNKGKFRLQQSQCFHSNAKRAFFFADDRIFFSSVGFLDVVRRGSVSQSIGYVADVFFVWMLLGGLGDFWWIRGCY